MVMDRTGWLWRRKPSDNSPGASESSVPVSSHPQCCSGDQEVLRPVSNNASVHHGQSPKVSSRVRHDETQETGVPKLSNEKLASRVNLNDFSPQHGQSLESYLSSNGDEETKETMKSLNEKLAAALLAISDKEDLVKQHAKVTEEAVAGWEQAEVEATAIKKLLEAASHRNDYLEGQVSHLDKALKECVRQLRLVREEQEEIIRDALTKKSQELEFENSKLQNHIAELKKQLAATKSEASTVSAQPDLQEKLQTIEKENLDLKAELLVQSKDLKILSLEKDLSNQAAETASKQHLESIKKIARVEAECRRLHHLAQKTALVNDSRPPPSAESLTDSHSDSAECMVAVDSELRNSDSWASALITELDQFRNAKASATNIMNSPVEIDLMDDFLEMERLAALPESDQTSSTFDMETDSDKAVTRNNSSKIENEELRRHVADLHSRVEIVESDKKELEIALIEARNQLDISCDALVAARNRLVEMQMQLDLANDSQYAALGDVDRLDSEKKALEFQLESKSVEAEELHAIVASLGENAEKKEFESQLELVSAEAAELRVTVASLEERIETETALSVQHKEKSDAACNAKELLETQLYSANAEVQNLHDIIKSLENQVEEQKALRDELMTQSLLKIEAAVEAVKKPLEAQLCSANTEVEKLHGIIEALENEIENERTVHEELTAQLDMKIEAERTHSEAIKESLEGQLCSANSEVAKLRDIIKALENEVVEKEKALHEKLAEAEKSLSVESVKESLEAELQLVNSEVVKLRDMVTALEHEVVKEKEFSDELQLQLEALEAIKRVLESEVESAHQDAWKLKEKVELFEAKLQEQMLSAAEFTAKEESVQSQRTAIEHQLEASKADVVKLTNMVSFLQGEVVQERLLSEDYEQKCRKLEAQLSRDIRDAKLWRLANSNGDLKTKQEKELANAAGKLAECQKTIASLGRQLKSLTEIDNVVLEPGLGLLLEPRDIALDLRASDPGLLQKRSTGSNFAVFADELYDLDLPDGDVGCFSPLPSMIRPSSPPPSEMSVFAGGLSSLSSYRGKRRK
ncbi:hypothetical protein ACQJBY_048677 [Aegilops geniculata]